MLLRNSFVFFEYLIFNISGEVTKLIKNAYIYISLKSSRGKKQKGKMDNYVDFISGRKKILLHFTQLIISMFARNQRNV